MRRAPHAALSLFITGCAAIVLIIPLDFVAVPAEVGSASAGATFLGALASCYAIWHLGDARMRRALIALLGGVFALGTFSGSLGTLAAVTAPIILGVGLAAVDARRQWFLGLLLGLLIITTLADQFLDRPLAFGWGAPLTTYYDGRSSRSRGMLGQPLPAALAIIVVGWLVLRQRRLPYLLNAGLIILCSISVVVTGSRSAVLVVAATLLLRLVTGDGRHAGGGRRTDWPPAQVAQTAFLVATIVALSRPILERLTSSRVLDFAGLAGTDSSVNRLQAQTLARVLLDRCDWTCAVTGSGVRSLQEYLRSYSAVSDLRTADNFFITAAWDLGFAASGLLLLGAVSAVRLLSDSGVAASRKAGAYGVLTVIMFSAFLDTIYIRSIALIFGLALGYALNQDPKPPSVRSSPPTPTRGGKHHA